MALIPATINVAWISNYTGPHRICYRVVGTLPYTCTLPGTPGPGFHPVCAGGGTPCGYTIDIMVDNETCDTVQYEGYVQAACEDESSMVGRMPFPTVSFVPSPACKRWDVTCVDSPVLDAVILDAGTGYTDGVYPALPVIGGGGTLATFDVTVAGRVITVVALATAGSGYTSAPTLDISSIPYAPGTLADILIRLVGCTALNVFDCTDTSSETIALGVLKPGDVYEMCGTTEPVVPADYAIVENGNCLCNCTQMTIIEDGGGRGTIDIKYIDCNGLGTSANILTGASLGPICMVTGSLSYVLNGDAAVTVIVGAACP